MIPTRIGQKFEGGYLAGINRIGNCAYLILAAPKSTECSVQFKTHWGGTPGTQLVNDGWANTNAMNDAAHPAAQYCRSLTVGGHTDLYLPSRDDLELCYRVFKPTNRGNVTCPAGTMSGNLRLANWTNLNSIPTGAAYTASNPARTIVTAFQTGNVEAFDTIDYYWTSTESSFTTDGSLFQDFFNGNQDWHGKTTVNRVRGVRRSQILLNDEKHNDTN